MTNEKMTLKSSATAHSPTVIPAKAGIQGFTATWL